MIEHGPRSVAGNAASFAWQGQNVVNIRRSLDWLAGAMAANRDFHCGRCANAEGAVPGAQSKVLMFIGAGVSAEAAQLPLADQLGSALQARMIGSCARRTALFEQTRTQIERDHGFPAGDIKTLLFALNRIDPDQLRHLVLSLCQSKAPEVVPSHYQLLARLLKERFVNAIIDFNFDTLLERALEESTVSREVLRVVERSSASLATDSLASHVRAPFGIHLKPHGSVSAPHTLRFARSDFYRLEPEVETLLRRLLAGPPCTLIIAGLKLKALDLCPLLKQCLHPQSELFVMDCEADVVGTQLNSFYAGFEQISARRSLESALFECYAKAVGGASR